MERFGEGGAAAGGPATGTGGEGSVSGLALLMEEWAHGVVVTTVGGRVVHANGAARRELARRNVLELRLGSLHAALPENAEALQDALGKAAEGKRSLVTLGGAEGPNVTLAVLPLKPEGARSVASIALVFERASVCESLMLWFFARSHGLTPTEEQVLGILCQGYSAPEAAKQLRVAVSTVRSHVRSVCAKTRSGSVRELVGRVAVLPPVAPFWQEAIH
ncbi:helix-turn-helix transcriptional regulator [Ramlibacter albus]|uniref:Helix-turn-helix transcriptional regulator n=1 Tax=Ramlibacter albus TaxID=2079448 RepID=A0A923M3Q2_9BURK|nr:helix-turn-helix transcriptional regulator [Ramlibacter albus]MBC5763380.1 helix-turn-helix transcriptional regulator [Ramlibacter albus]